MLTTRVQQLGVPSHEIYLRAQQGVFRDYIRKFDYFRVALPTGESVLGDMSCELTALTLRLPRSQSFRRN
jgi:hypothetical protein